MTLTVRPRGQLLPPDGEGSAIEVTAVVWSDRQPGNWGGIVEAEVAAPMLRERVRAGQKRYRLRLADGREGLVELALSEFEADGARPLTFTGASVLNHG